MIKLRDKKGAELTVRKLIAIILLLVVIVFAYMFIFNPKILDWVRNLPGFDQPEDEDRKVDVTDKIEFTFDCVDVAEIERVPGKHALHQFTDARKIYLVKDGNLVESGMFIIVEDRRYVFYVEKWIWGMKRQIIGQVKQEDNFRRIRFDGSIIETGGKVNLDLISLKDLEKLEGAYLRINRFTFCQDKVEIDRVEEFWKPKEEKPLETCEPGRNIDDSCKVSEKCNCIKADEKIEGVTSFEACEFYCYNFGEGCQAEFSYDKCRESLIKSGVEVLPEIKECFVQTDKTKGNYCRILTLDPSQSAAPCNCKKSDGSFEICDPRGYCYHEDIGCSYTAPEILGKTCNNLIPEPGPFDATPVS